MHSSGTAHDVLLPIERVCEILSRSKASIYRDIKPETFPKLSKNFDYSLSVELTLNVSAPLSWK